MPVPGTIVPKEILTNIPNSVLNSHQSQHLEKKVNCKFAYIPSRSYLLLLLNTVLSRTFFVSIRANERVKLRKDQTYAVNRVIRFLRFILPKQIQPFCFRVLFSFSPSWKLRFSQRLLLSHYFISSLLAISRRSCISGFALGLQTQKSQAKTFFSVEGKKREQEQRKKKKKKKKRRRW